MKIKLFSGSLKPFSVLFREFRGYFLFLFFFFFFFGNVCLNVWKDDWTFRQCLEGIGLIFFLCLYSLGSPLECFWQCEKCGISRKGLRQDLSHNLVWRRDCPSKFKSFLTFFWVLTCHVSLLVREKYTRGCLPFTQNPPSRNLVHSLHNRRFMG